MTKGGLQVHASRLSDRLQALSSERLPSMMEAWMSRMFRPANCQIDCSHLTRQIGSRPFVSANLCFWCCNIRHLLAQRETVPPISHVAAECLESRTILIRLAPAWEEKITVSAVQTRILLPDDSFAIRFSFTRAVSEH